MALELTKENWKDYKFDEASRLFSIDDIVMFDFGFVRFDEKLGKVVDIKKSGIVYVVDVELEMVERNKLEYPVDCQSAGWGRYNPTKVVSLGEEVHRFLPNFFNNFYDHFDEEQNKWISKNYIKFNGPKGKGRYNLHPAELDENGLIKRSWDSVL